MVLDLKQLFNIEGEKLAFSYELDLSDIELWGNHPFRTPIKITGQVTNRSSMVSLAYTADFELYYTCDRCLQEVIKKQQLTFEHALVLNLNQDYSDDFIVVENAVLNIDELAESDILLGMPIKLLCSEDCKGLCHVCGKNLNAGNCGCKLKQCDPRLEALKELIE